MFCQEKMPGFVGVNRRALAYDKKRSQSVFGLILSSVRHDEDKHLSQVNN